MLVNYHFIIIGGGIVGLSTAMQLLQKYPGKKVVVLEKEGKLASHQTGHNSGVIHAGVYYEPGSFKAKFCKLGVEQTIEFCSKHQLPFEQCGKLIVATDDQEVIRMQNLFERCKKNGLNPEMLNEIQLKKLEPNVTGLGAIKVQETGIVDYISMAKAMANEFESLGGEIRLNAEVISLKETKDYILLKLKSGDIFKSKYLIACAGLQSDRIAKMMGVKIDFQIVPFRGDYFKLNKKFNKIVNHLIYPIPDPAYPFLGVHLTKMIDGSVTVGPNAVLNLSREGYGKFNFNFKDFMQMSLFGGFWKLFFNSLRPAFSEIYSSLNKKSYLKLCQKYCPSLTISDLEPYRSGVRAQAVSKDGKLIHDFLIEETSRSFHVCNAPSPAATSSLPIGKYIVKLVNKKIRKSKNGKKF